jgi:hypothetical protein
MTEDLLQYDRLVERALKNVVREALTFVSEHGLPGAHHLYVTFRTDHPDVTLSDELREKYPLEMTIVLQYQFWDLIIGDDQFEVTLSFNDRHQRLVVPFSAVNAFADPSVNFALQFQPAEAAAQRRRKFRRRTCRKSHRQHHPPGYLPQGLAPAGSGHPPTSPPGRGPRRWFKTI